MRYDVVRVCGRWIVDIQQSRIVEVRAGDRRGHRAHVFRFSPGVAKQHVEAEVELFLQDEREHVAYGRLAGVRQHEVVPTIRVVVDRRACGRRADDRLRQVDVVRRIVTAGVQVVEVQRHATEPRHVPRAAQ